MSSSSLAKHFEEEVAVNVEQKTKGKGHCEVDRKFVPVKIVYFTFFAGQCAVLYRSVFAKHLGLSTTQNGLVWAIDRVLGIVFPPILGAISDKTKKPKAVIQAVFFVVMIAFAAMYLIPIEKSKPTVNCFNSTCYQVFYPNTSQCHFTNASSLQCDTTDHPNNTTLASKNPCVCYTNDSTTEDEYGVTFWAFLVLSILTSIAIFGVNGVVDMFFLNKYTARERHRFGNTRLFGAIGFGTGALLIGFFKDQLTELGLEGNIPYIPFAFGPLLFWSFLQVALCFIDSSQAEKSEAARFADLKIIFSDARMVAFVLYMIVLGYVISVGESYMFWYAEEKFDAEGTMMGTSVVIASCFDVIMYLLSGRMMKKFGPNLVFSCGIFLLGLRLLCYTAATRAWHLVAAEALRGVSWAVTWIACCIFIADTTPPELRATTMGAVNAVLWGIGYGSGSLLGGVMYQNLGADNMFRISFAFSSITTVVYLTFYLCYERPRKKIKLTEDSREEVLKLKEPDQNHNCAKNA